MVSSLRHRKCLKQAFSAALQRIASLMENSDCLKPPFSKKWDFDHATARHLVPYVKNKAQFKK
jgi:hypothetical protein